MALSPRRKRRWEGDRGRDQRNQFQRDRDRILYTSAFRRLAWVAQVVSSEEGEPFHNRLTHTLEVAQIGRRLAEKFLSRQGGKARELGGIDPDVVEAAALAHDMGHPPFGHIAEERLHECMKAQGVCDGFEGNAQSFRIVTRLAIRHSDIQGLNLTRATLNAILKYPWLWRDRPERNGNKWGAYATEEEEFEWVRKDSLPGGAQCVEAAIMDLSDDIAYAVHDVEDFYRAGLIPLDRLTVRDDELGKFAAYASKALARAGAPADYDLDACRRVLRKALERYKITEPYSGTRDQRGRLRSMTADLIGRYIKAAELCASADEGSRRVRMCDEDAEKELAIFKQLLWYYVIDGAALASQQYGQRRIVSELFSIFHGELGSPSLGVFPMGYRERLEELRESGRSDTKEDRARIVADLIAGMTEQEAVAMYHRLTGVSLGTVMNGIVR